MERQEDSGLIVFDNLVQADNNITGDNQPVKARREAGRSYAQENASGEPYRPNGLEDIKVRAEVAGDRFKHFFGTMQE